jgi:hypothetical protein
VRTISRAAAADRLADGVGQGGRRRADDDINGATARGPEAMAVVVARLIGVLGFRAFAFGVTR